MMHREGQSFHSVVILCQLGRAKSYSKVPHNKNNPKQYHLRTSYASIIDYLIYSKTSLYPISTHIGPNAKVDPHEDENMDYRFVVGIFETPLVLRCG